MSANGILRRRGVRVVLVVFVVFLLAAVLTPMLVPAEKWKQLVFAEIEKQTGLVAEASDAKVSLIPLGMQLSDFTVRDPLNRPEYSGLDLAVQRVVVRAQLGALLRGRVEVQEVRLVEPVVRLQLADTGAGQAKASSSPEIAGALALLSIENGEVHLVDARGGQTHLEGLQNRASATVAQGRANGELRGSFEDLRLVDAKGVEQKLPRLEWEATFEASIDGGPGVLEFVALRGGGLDATGTLGWSTPATGPPVLDMKLEAQGDVREAYLAFARPQLEVTGFPEPWTLDDFDVLEGRATATVVLKGAIPESEDPLAIVDLMQITGSAEGVKARLLDRNDLVTASSRFELEGRAIALKDLKLDGPVFRGSGALAVPLDPVANVTGTLALAIESGAARALAESWWPRLSVLAGEDAAGPQDWPRVAGMTDLALRLDLPPQYDPEKGPADAVRWTLTAKHLGVLPPTLRDSLHVEGLRVTGNAERADVQQIHVRGPGLDANAQLAIDGWPEVTRVRGEVVANALDLDLLQALVVTEEKTASLWTFGATPAHAATPAAAPPANLDLDLRMRATSASTRGYALTDLKARAVLVEQKLKLQEIGAAIGGGSVGGTVDVDWTVQPPRWNTDLVAQAIGAGSLLEPIVPLLAGALNTSLSSKIQMDGVLDPTPAVALAALSGLAGITSGAGSVQTEPVLGPKISQFLAGRAAQWQKLDFSSLTADVKVDAGKVIFDRFVIQGGTEVRLAGFVSLEGDCDYRLDVRLPAGVTPELGALEPLADLLRDDQKRIAFGVDVTGPAGKPKVQIDFAELEKRAEDKGKQQIQKKLEDTLKDKAGELLGGLRKKGKG